MTCRLMMLLASVVFSATVSAQFAPLECNEPLTANGPVYRPFSEVFGTVQEGDVVEIPCGMAVRLDVKSLPRLGGLSITGHLLVPQKDGFFNIFTDWVLVQGRLEAGKSRGHFKEGSGLSITLTHSESNDLILDRDGKSLNFGRKAFAVVGGQLDLKGLPGGRGCRSKTWNKLAMTAEEGSNVLVIDEDVRGCWAVGHTIVVSSTSTNYRERENRTIKGMISTVSEDGKVQTRLVINRPMNYRHTGLDTTFMAAGGMWITEAAEVGLVTRSISIAGESQPNDKLEGGHLVIFETDRENSIEGVEFFNMGQQGVLGRYPTHFHMCGDVRGSSFVANSVHDTLQRGLVIHGSNNLRVEYNVFSNVLGHGILLEDHSEVGNVIRKNAGFFNDSPSKLININGRSESDNRPSMFWITNPDNVIEDNVASGCGFSGFWFELSNSVRGLSLLKYPELKNFNPKKAPLGSFKGNESHSNRSHGLRTYPNGYSPVEEAQFRDLSIWKNEFGVFLHNSVNVTVVNSVLADNRHGGLDFNEVLDCTLRDSVVIGKSALRTSCPTYGAVRNSGNNRAHYSGGNRMENVRLDKFGECDNPVISQRIQSDEKDGVMPASTAVIDVSSYDRDDNVIDLDRGFASTDGKWRYAAFEVAGGNVFPNGGRAGYLVTNLPIMRNAPQESSPACSTVSTHTLICENSCYRTVRFSFGVNSNEFYTIRFTRVTDKVVETLSSRKTTGRSLEFYMNLRAGHEYIVDLVLPSGASHPNRVHFAYSDGAKACRGAVTLLFQNRGFFWRTMDSRLPALKKPCPGGEVSAPENSATYYDRCSTGMLYRVVDMPAMPLRSFRTLYIDVDTNAGAPSQDACDQATRCLAFGKYSSWNYFDRGFEPERFTESNADLSEWKTGAGKFAYGFVDDTISTDLEEKHRAYYFRKQINIDGDITCYSAASHTAMSLAYKDGIAIYVNGEELFRKNLPAGELEGTMLATGNGIGNRYDRMPLEGIQSFLRRGQNTIAVEIHRRNGDTSTNLQMIFDMQLEIALRSQCMPGF